MQMCHLFRHLLKVWSTDFGTAVLYGNDQKSISYAELADMIRSAESEIRLSGIRSELIVTDHEPATLIRDRSRAGHAHPDIRVCDIRLRCHPDR